MTVRVDHHPPQFFVGLFLGLSRSEFYGVLSRLFQVGNPEVKVILLGMLLSWPCRRRVVLDPLEIERYPRVVVWATPYSG